MIYLSHPYASSSKKDPAQEHLDRIDASVRIARIIERWQVRDIQPVFTPVAFGEGQMLAGATEPDNGWYAWCIAWVNVSKSITVLEFPGWDKSTGVRLEIDQADYQGILINYWSWDRCKQFLPDRLWERMEWNAS